ncbi:MAG: cadherin-like domain-containing protein [Nannocystis sp.]|nr:cadherin-like domain-containing protein [Nannocystis sp.]
MSKQRQLVAVGAAQGLLANDTDPDGDLFLLKVVAVDAISAGGAKISFDPSGGFTYDPPKELWGDDTFGYTITDGCDVFQRASRASASSPARSTSPTSPLARAAS